MNNPRLKCFLFMMMILLFSCKKTDNLMDKYPLIETSSIIESVDTTANAVVDKTQSDIDLFFNDFSEFDKYKSNKNKKPIDFSGVYKIIDIESEYSFTLTLNQTGKIVKGNYCGYNKTRYDCGLESQGLPDCPVKGIVVNDTCYISFISCYRGKKGTATLHKKGYNIYWTLTEEPPIEVMDYFSGPYDGDELVNQFINPKTNLKLNLDNSSPFQLSTLLYPGNIKLFNTCKLYRTMEFEEIISEIQEGEDVYIQNIGTEYPYVKDELDEIMLNYYQVKYKNEIGFLKKENLPLKSFTNDNGEEFLIGMDADSKVLQLKSYRLGKRLGNELLLDYVYEKDGFGNLFVELVFKFRPLENIKMKGITFYEFNYENNGSGGYAGNTYYYWNGSSMKPITIEKRDGKVLISQNLEVISTTDYIQAKDTLIYTLKTGYILDESLEFSDIEFDSYKFTIENDTLKPVISNQDLTRK